MAAPMGRSPEAKSPIPEDIAEMPVKGGPELRAVSDIVEVPTDTVSEPTPIDVATEPQESEPYVPAEQSKHGLTRAQKLGMLAAAAGIGISAWLGLSGDGENVSAESEEPGDDPNAPGLVVGGSETDEPRGSETPGAQEPTPEEAPGITTVEYLTIGGAEHALKPIYEAIDYKDADTIKASLLAAGVDYRGEMLLDSARACPGFPA